MANWWYLCNKSDYRSVSMLALIFSDTSKDYRWFHHPFDENKSKGDEDSWYCHHGDYRTARRSNKEPNILQGD